MHTRNDSGVSVRSFAVHDNPPSPTLTNPDMIMPIPPWQSEHSFEDDQEGPHPLLEPEVPLSQTISNSSISTTSTARGSADELGVATAVLMPGRTTARPPTTLHGDETPIPTYMGYEHGAPLSDIYEESEATATPKSTHVSRDDRSPSPTPARESSTTPTRQVLRHKKRISSLSTSSSGGSDVGDWENFDSSKVLSSRVAADLAQMKREESLDVDSQDMASRRQSREEEELAALNARAEKILENARKRLTHMEDNLKVARNSIIMPQRSPNLGGEHQPVGGLYRSISAAGANKLAKNRQYPQIRTSSSLQHMRGNSETGVSNTTKRLSRLPDMRSASALEYGSPGRYSLFPDVNQTITPVRVQPSPASSRSFNSPLRPLEEERASPSTAETTPESVKIPPMRGLGILSSAAQTRENLSSSTERPSSRQTPTPTLMRSSSSASARSTKDLKDQMSDLKSRMMDIRMKTQADHLRRRSMQSVRSSSPFANSPAEQWYASSPNYNEPGSPVNTNAGIGWATSSSPTLPQSVRGIPIQDRSGEPGPITPANARFLDVDRMSPTTEARILSSARTDRNTPSLVRRQEVVDNIEDEDEDDRSSVIHRLRDNDNNEGNGSKNNDPDEPAVEQIAQNEEEQIYLNEVLEESLRDAEVEPEVPPIPASYLEGPDGMTAFMNAEAERHEDRLDAFDYENMFLHSAMGTYTGKSLTGSESDSELASDDDGSVETSRADARTPVDDLEEQDLADTEPPTDDEMEDVMVDNNDQFHLASKSPVNVDHAELRSPPDQVTTDDSKLHVHARSKSMESVSTSATFETATEGERDDETPNEIYDWNPLASSSLGYSPTSYQAYRSVRNSPVNTRHGFSSPQAGGRVTPKSPKVGSPLKQHDSQHFEPIIDQKRLYPSPGLGMGIVGAENAQYISDDGVPQRFQGKPSPTHSRESSVNTLQHFKIRPESSATVVLASPAKGHQRQQSSVSAVARVLTSSPLTPAHRRTPNGSNTSPVIVTVTSSPQRKVVINRALQQPESFVLSPQLSSPPNMPLPAPPASSAALQAQMASPKKVDIRSSKGHRSSPAQKRSSAIQQRAGLQSPALMNASSPPNPNAPVPNTEVLMESLIKLADPAFSLAPGMRFDEVDKNLVLGLLGAVGGVCNNILRAGIQTGSPEIGRSQAEESVNKLRQRLERAAEVLEGKEEERLLERERQAFGNGKQEVRGLRIKET